MDALVNVTNEFRHRKKAPSNCSPWRNHVRFKLLELYKGSHGQSSTAAITSGPTYTWLHIHGRSLSHAIASDGQRPGLGTGWLVPEHPSRVCDRRGGVNPSARGSLQPARGASSCPSQRVKRAVLKGASSAWCLSIDNIYLVKMERETTYRALYKVCFVQETLLMNKPFPIILSLLHPSSFPQTLQTCQAYSLQGLLQTVFVISFSLSRSLI